MMENVTVNAQSSIRIQGEGQVIYFDPFEIKEEKRDAAVIFVTHDHFDHFQPESIAKVKKADTILVAPKSMKEKAMAESGILAGNCIFLEPGENRELEGLHVEAVASYNVLKPFHLKAKGYLGYVVEMDGTRYYVAGDTDPNEDNRKVKCDVALVPVGGHYTMDKKKAAEFVALLKPKAAVPTHYGSVVGTPGDGEDFKKLLGALNSEIQTEIKL